VRVPLLEEGGLAIVRPSDLFRESAAGAPRKTTEMPLHPAGGQAGDVGRAGADPSKGEPPAASEGSPYASAKQEVGRILDAAAAGHRFQIGALQRLVADMATSILGGDDLLVQALNDGEADFDVPRHQVNTAIFAIKVGQGAGCRPEELPRLGLAACLHDAGMITVPKRILDHPGPLSADEWALVRGHPEKGFRILETLGPEFEWLAQIALQEHEREDGSGYPRGLNGSEIHEYAKIVGVADAYESLTHVRPYRGKRSAFDAVKELITVQRAKFPDRALKGLIRGLSTFPVGSHVRLNSMEIARIVGTNPAFPLRPVIEVVVGPKGERLDPPRRVDLATNTLLYVTEAYSGRALV
jgi:HD-GYP domain-containing protein (c-di-GMP phosphodiesterase class II)